MYRIACILLVGAALIGDSVFAPPQSVEARGVASCSKLISCPHREQRQHQLRPARNVHPRRAYNHAKKHNSAPRRIAAINKALSDLKRSAWRRSCIAHIETRGSTHPYTQLSLYSNPKGIYKGKYQYDNGTWQTALARAQAFYRGHISSARRADKAKPYAQNLVTAFAVMHVDLLGWDPWSECR